MEPTKREIKKRGQTKWEVDYGFDGAGTRKRNLHNTEAEADAAIATFKKSEKCQGDFLARLNQVERQTLVAVLTEIKVAGLALADVWSAYKTHKAEISAQAFTKPMPYEKVVEEWRKRKEEAGTSVRYVKNTHTFLLKFAEGREQQNIHEITVDDLETWMATMARRHGWSLRTKDTYQVLFSSLWSTAIAKGWCNLNIVDRLQPINLPGKEVKIYTNDETLNLMAAVMSNPATQQIIAPMTLGFFGCMRPEEVESKRAKSEGVPEEKWFNWADIDLKNGLVKVRREIAKVGDERTIRLQPCAVEWLKLAKELKNPLPSVNERRLVDACCKQIGLAEWIRDGMRKNCATHLRAVYKNDYEVTQDCGNSVGVLLESYAALHVPREVSLAHWKITPRRVREHLQSKEWEDVLREASVKAVKTAEAQPAP
jgi:integrase